jgi:hypothetical protein
MWGVSLFFTREPTLTPQQIKKALVAAGFEVFRTQGDDIVVADRVRENLIMDSGVRLSAPGNDEEMQIKVVLRCQRADFPGEDERTMFDRVRSLARPALAQGFHEISCIATKVTDPSDEGRTLDTFYEVTFAKDVGGLEAALDELRFLLGIDKTVKR